MEWKKGRGNKWAWSLFVIDKDAHSVRQFIKKFFESQIHE